MPLSQYAKYAFYCLRLWVVYNIGLKCNLIKTSRSQNTYFDLEYFYYLPFCHFFSSDDKFHKNLSSLFLRKNQAFIEKESLRKNSNFIINQSQENKINHGSSEKNWQQKSQDKLLLEDNKKNHDTLKDLLHRLKEGIQIKTGKSLETGMLTKKYDRLTLKEKNLESIDKIVSILDLKKYDWSYVKKNLNSNHVKEFYEFYGDIWRPDSDIFRHYGANKYTSYALVNIFGGVHKTLINFIFALSIYFDGFYIFDFFKNPWFFRKKYNPISKPKQYIGDSLKDFCTLFHFQDFIVCEHIKILPLPSEFIKDFFMDKISFGNKIQHDFEINSEDENIMAKNGLELLLSCASRTSNAKNFLKQHNFNFDHPEMPEMIDTYCKSLKEQDPFVLNQPLREEMISRKQGTPEPAYMISRLKGIPIITNSKTIQNAFTKNLLKRNNIWSDFMNKINRYEFKTIPWFAPNQFIPIQNNQLRDTPLFDMKLRDGFFKDFHRFLRDVFQCAIYCGQNIKKVNELNKELDIQLNTLDKKWNELEKELREKRKEADIQKYIQKINLHFIIEPEGFKMPEADKWIEKYMKGMDLQKSTVLIYGNLN